MSHTIRRAHERGLTKLGWLESHHLFSFGSYRDEENVGFGALRVVNDDTVKGGMGFDNHTHENMEIISIVLSGALEHRDSLGTASVLRAGDVQVMTAGVGVTHAELNHDHDELVHFLQIWIEPKEQQLPSAYEEKHSSFLEEPNRLHILASGFSDVGALPIQSNARVMMASLETGASASYTVDHDGNGVMVYVVEGEVEVAGEVLKQGDSLRIADPAAVVAAATTASKVLMIDVAMEP